MVTAGANNWRTTSHDTAGTAGAGSEALMRKRSPMVSTLSAKPLALRISTPTVITTMAINEPGSLFKAERWPLTYFTLFT